MFKIDEKVIFDGFKCIITDLFTDCETGIEYASVKPLDFDGFEREVKITNLTKEVEIINATPHAINVVNEKMEVVASFEPTISVRVASTTQVVGTLNSIPLDTTVFGEVEGLPKYQDGIYYIVSRLVKSALPDRKDLLCPGQQVRNETGQVIGCKSLSL